MADYIAREAALSKSEILTVHTKEFGKIDVVPVEYIADLPTADVEPVVHGRWKFLNDYESHCSACGQDIGIDHENEYRFYPSCGAKMQEVR